MFKYGMSNEHYDYTNQAWVDAEGRYIRCWHPEEMDCKCHGKIHAGEIALDKESVKLREERQSEVDFWESEVKQ